VSLGHRRTEEFLALDPHDPKSHIEHGESLLRQRRYPEAAEAYLTAARLGPLGTAIAYAMAGECFERAGEPILAEDCFVQSLRVDPFAISAARGWRRVTAAPASAAASAPAALAAGYAADLEAWGAARTTAA
jgi:tetratricopeptide (TPR) repeat protein